MAPYIALAVVSMLPLHASVSSPRLAGDARTAGIKRQFVQTEKAKKDRLKAILRVMLADARMYP